MSSAFDIRPNGRIGIDVGSSCYDSFMSNPAPARVLQHNDTRSRQPLLKWHGGASSAEKN
jgi:hypothetical protein